MKITRRHALLGAAAPLIVKRETAFGSQANSAVAFGIIGTGGRGRYVGGFMAKDSNAKLAAICDKYPDRIDLGKTEIPGADQVPAYRDYQELLARPDIDAVLIATPVFLHPEHFEAAVKAGKHAFIEKPMGVTPVDAQAIVDACSASGVSCGVAFVVRQAPAYRSAREIVSSGAIGLGSYTIVDWIAGKNKAPSFPSLTANDQTALTNFLNNGGALFIGEKGQIRIDRGRFEVSDPSWKTIPLESMPVQLYTAGSHYRNFVDCIKNRKKCVCDVETGHRSATVCHLGNIARWVSQQTQTVGTKLVWDPVKEQFKDNAMANSMLDRPRRKGYELPKV